MAMGIGAKIAIGVGAGVAAAGLGYAGYRYFNRPAEGVSPVANPAGNSVVPAAAGNSGTPTAGGAVLATPFGDVKLSDVREGVQTVGMFVDVFNKVFTGGDVKADPGGGVVGSSIVLNGDK